MVKRIEWNKEKDRLLIKSRSVSFSMVADKLISGDILDVIDNPGYKNQKIFIIKINGYIHCVPFVEDEEKIFLKTIYANRKINKKLNK